MEDPRWLRLITIGLVLSALAVGYFLLTGRFASTKTTKTSAPSQSQQETAQVSPSPSASVLGDTSTPAPGVSAPSVTDKGGSYIAALPKTGFPAVLIITFSASAVAAGFGLRKFPN